MRIFFALLLLPALAHAETRLEPWQVIGTVTADWNDDGRQDRAILGYDPDGMVTTLSLYLGDDTGGFTLTAELVDEIWMGSLWGMQPDLSLDDDGTLVVSSRNIALGRGRWEDTLRVGYDGSDFIVTGYSTDYYDTMNLETGSGDCVVDYGAGSGVFGTFRDTTRLETPFTFPARTVLLENWTYDDVPSDCHPDL